MDDNGVPIINPQAAEAAAMEDFRCPVCDDSRFEMLKAVVFGANKIDKNVMKPRPVVLYRCLTCQGILYHKKEGGWGVMGRDPHAKETERRVLSPVVADGEKKGVNGNVVRGPW